MSRASSSAASSSSLPSYSASRNYAASLAARAEDALPGGGPRFVRQASFADDDLHYACRVGDLTKIRKYLDAKPGLIMLKDGYGNLPLYYACLCGHMGAVNLLLERGAYDSDHDRCWSNALDIPIRLRLRQFEAENPHLYPYSNARKPKGAAKAAAAMAAQQAAYSSAASSSSAAAPAASAGSLPLAPVDLGEDPFVNPALLLHSMRVRLELAGTDADRFGAELVGMLSEFSGVLIQVGAGAARREAKNVSILKHLSGTVSGLDPLVSHNAPIPPNAVNDCFIAWLFARLRSFPHEPRLVNDGLRILALLCSDHPANLELFANHLDGLQFLDQFIEDYMTGKQPAPPMSPLGSAAAAAATASSSASASKPRLAPEDDPEFILHFLQTLNHLAKRSNRGAVGRIGSTPPVRWHHLLPFLLRCLRSFLDFPPIASAILSMLKSILDVGDVEKHYQFLMFTGIQLCVAAYLAYVRLDLIKDDEDEDEAEEDAQDGDEDAGIKTVRGLDEDEDVKPTAAAARKKRVPAAATAASASASSSSSSSAAAADSSSSSSESTLAADVSSQIQSREDRHTRTQVSRLSMQLLSKWISLPRGDEEALSRLAPNEPPKELPGATAAATSASTTSSSSKDAAVLVCPTAASQLREAYSFLRLANLHPNPLTDVGLSYASWFNNRMLSDVVFVFDGADAQPIFAHKIVLAARCDYFRMMFSGGFSAGSSGFRLGGGGGASSLGLGLSKLTLSSSRQVSSSSLGLLGDETLLTELRISSYSRTTFLQFLEYLYVGLNARGLFDVAERSTCNGMIITAQQTEAEALRIKQRVVHEQLASYKARGEIAPAYYSEDPVLKQQPPRIDTLSNTPELIELLRVSDEYALVQLRVMIEYLIYGQTSSTHLICVDTVWTLLAASLHFHAPMLELHCLRFIVHLFETDEERQLTQARGFKRQRKQTLQAYGFLPQ